METGYFFIGDLLGFSRIVENSSDAELSSRLDGWFDLVQEAVRISGIKRFQLLSDTVFAASDSSEAGLRQIVALSRHLLESGIAKSLPVRGAISHGTFQWGNVTFGKAVISSHSLEQAQQWIGISCSPTLPHLDSLWSLSGLVCYPVPLRTGPIRLHPAVAWSVPDSPTLARALSSNGLARAGEVLTWEWGHRISQTTQFRLYLKLLGLVAGSPDRFHGMLPLEAIELNFPPRRV